MSRNRVKAEIKRLSGELDRMDTLVEADYNHSKYRRLEDDLTCAYARLFALDQENAN